MGRSAKDNKVANGGGVSNGKAKRVEEAGGGGGGREGGTSDKCRGGSLRERLVKPHARDKPIVFRI